MSIDHILHWNLCCLIELICSSINTIEAGIGLDFKIFSLALFSIFASLLTAFFVNWKLTLITLCVVPFVLGGSLLFGKVEKTFSFVELQRMLVDHGYWNNERAQGAIQSRTDRWSVHSSIRTVLSFNGGTYEQKR